MEGAAITAGQYAPAGSEGTSKNLKPIQYDPERAKKLLAEAGYPNGFRIQLTSTGKRYPNDFQAAEAVGQMWAQIGIKAEVVTLPGSVIFRRGTSGGPGGTPEFSFFMAGCCSSTGAALTPLTVLMGTRNKAKAIGTANRGRYSNPELDKLIEQGLVEMDAEKRATVVAKATEVAVEDMAVIPLYFLVNTWATRGKVGWEASIDDATVPRAAYLIK